MMGDFSLVAALEKLGIDAKTGAALTSRLQSAQLEKGEPLLRQGDLAPNLFFIVKGLVKLVYVTFDGRERVKSFVSEGNVVGSLSSQMQKAPSPFSIICLEDCQVETVPFDTVNALADKDPALTRYALKLYQQLALKKEIREHDLLCLSATERYQKFLADSQGFAHRLKQVDIASYLGITPVALSRIRSRMK